MKRKPPRPVPRYQKETELGELRRAYVTLVLFLLAELDEMIPDDLNVRRVGDRIAIRDRDRILTVAEPGRPQQREAKGRDITWRELAQLVYGVAWFKDRHLHQKSLPKLADEKYGRAWYQGRHSKTGLPVLPPRPLDEETRAERALRINRTVQLVAAAIRYVEDVLGVSQAWVRRRPRRRRRS